MVATIRFAGDSGDGMQLAGQQFAETCGSSGYEVNTFPDYPSEIRAPEGTLYGVSAYQVHFGVSGLYTMGDALDVLVVMNAASLKVNLPLVRKGGVIIADVSGFDDGRLALAKFSASPLVDGSLADYNVISLDIPKIFRTKGRSEAFTVRDLARTRNVFVLGVSYGMFGLSPASTIAWFEKKFGSRPQIKDANLHALSLGVEEGTHAFSGRPQTIASAAKTKGRYRTISGNEAVALGLVAASKKSGLPLFLGTYPITPATDILHYLSHLKNFGVRHLQAEDEIAGICSAIGAAYGGNLAATTTSGPGLSLKAEALGLAVMTELPLIVVDVQRAGPSTGLPTKPEQSDLLMTLFGRHGEAPLPVVAAANPADCFELTLEAARLALKYMTPVILLSDGYVGQATMRWRVPEEEGLPEVKAYFATSLTGFAPYKRDEQTLRRQWAIPGFEGMEHRIGGLEKEDGSGNVSHDPVNHEKMVRLRSEKIARIAHDIPPALPEGAAEGELLVISWGSTYGAAKAAFEAIRADGASVSFLQLRHLNPFPANLGDVLSRFSRIVVPELNSGQLKMLLQATFLRKVDGINKIQGKPFTADELTLKFRSLLIQNEIHV